MSTQTTGTAGDRRELTVRASMTRNVPLRPEEWDVLLHDLETCAAETDAGRMAFAVIDGQLRLHYMFGTDEELKADFWSLWNALHPTLTAYGHPYLAIDLVELPNRAWIAPLLDEAHFTLFGDWIDMERHEVHGMHPPAIPDGCTMRKATPSDFERILDIADEAYAQYGDGEVVMRARLNGAQWIGVLEEGGQIVAYAINAQPDSTGVGRILSAAVAPEAWGQGYGRVILEAAAYQLGTKDARRAVIRIVPEAPHAVETAMRASFRTGRRGLQFRRPTDEAAIAAALEEQRRVGMKVRFGEWR